ncbi:MAG: translation initiation factor IF-3 [Candidatus Ratteibacteria bacterium]|nr:translation initiation factor IF-3 [Candidatus Ratteibacteria bacterium]
MQEKTQRVRINRWIRAETVRVIGPDGSQIGVMPLNRALYIAKELELDLVEVAPTTKPPVCRIIDFGKYRYEQQKREKSQKKQQRIQQMKEMTFRPSIGEHDFEVKVKHIREFLEDGHKAKVMVQFRRGEMTHKDRGNQILAKVEKEVEKVGKVVKPCYMLGKNLIMVLAPTEIRKEKNAKTENKEIGG